MKGDKPTNWWIVKDGAEEEIAVVYGEDIGDAIDAAIDETGLMGGFYVRRLKEEAARNRGLIA
ncbi:hypothetical protein E1264_03420 [Actinomadura sp. KC216]|uniref:hypothetical protein n=1 Tax=Actinomadura sp. KC216 TaxID=2530370 RepID=UPI001050121A|nr:hypothetical protein [Actinomadura sp. KC216]TDB90889.1 hypothetical protein E1264_03420 [Actinomadura sp. KC216]